VILQNFRAFEYQENNKKVRTPQMPVTKTPIEEYHETNDSSTKNIMDVKILKVIAKVLLP
jgi:hypothetical protein